MSEIEKEYETLAKWAEIDEDHKSFGEPTMMGFCAPAKRALKAAYSASPIEEDVETYLGDMFSDLYHLCDHLGICPHEMIQKGWRTYDGDLEILKEFATEEEQ